MTYCAKLSVSMLLKLVRFRRKEIVYGPERGVGPLVYYVSSRVTEAPDLERTDLGVERELLEVHLAPSRDCQSLGEGDEAIWSYSDEPDGRWYWELEREQ